MTPEQEKYIKLINPAPIHHLLDTNHEYAIQYVNAILIMLIPQESNETNRFLTTQKPGDETQLTPIQKRILQELIDLQKLEKLNPQDNQKSRNKILSAFDRTDSTADTKARKTIEE